MRDPHGSFGWHELMTSNLAGASDPGGALFALLGQQAH